MSHDSHVPEPGSLLGHRVAQPEEPPVPAMKYQVGGDHYKAMKIQPVQLGWANRYDDCTFSAVKYVSRHRVKSGKTDLAKALHFVGLRCELLREFGEYEFAVSRIPIRDYVTANGIEGMDAMILVDLHSWAVSPEPDHIRAATIVSLKIINLATIVYGGDRLPLPAAVHLP